MVNDLALGGSVEGGFAEYLLLNEAATDRKPESLSDEEFATLTV
jgi:NADPH:quinone reductase-like Zn-dependent oxidoreductase